MKRASNLIYKIADVDNLRLAFWKSRKRKDRKVEVIAYRKQLDKNLLQLHHQLLAGKVEVGDYHYFTIHDPKERIICAASFPERVLHHALMNVCQEFFENYQIFDSYATRKGKGTYAALHRAQYFNKKYRWYLKLDIRKYFDSIDQATLLQLLEKRFKDQKLLLIFKQIIFSYEVKTGKGLPIGNLTSQYFANFYLAFADRYIKEQLKMPAYVRYMDDMVIWHSDKQELLKARQQITLFLEQQLYLKLKLAQLNKTIQGLPFLGYRVFPNYTKLSLRSKKRFKTKMKTYTQYLEEGYWSQEDYQRHILPLIAFSQHASTMEYRKKILQKIGQ